MWFSRGPSGMMQVGRRKDHPRERGHYLLSPKILFVAVNAGLVLSAYILYVRNITGWALAGTIVAAGLFVNVVLARAIRNDASGKTQGPPKGARTLPLEPKDIVRGGKCRFSSERLHSLCKEYHWLGVGWNNCCRRSIRQCGSRAGHPE